MKHPLYMTLLAATLLSGPAFAAKETYTLDSDHTNIDWRINHFGFSNPSGKFTKAKGSLTLDETKPENSHIDVTLSPGDVVTGIPKLDEHIRSSEFFDIAKFPTAHFQSRKINLTGKHTARVMGDLTLHGVTRPVTLDVTLNKIGMNMLKKKTAGFTATTTIKRSDFGITSFLPDLGDDVTLHIESEANMQADEPNQ